MASAAVFTSAPAVDGIVVGSGAAFGFAAECVERARRILFVDKNKIELLLCQIGTRHLHLHFVAQTVAVSGSASYQTEFLGSKS